ncbi:hypothetical protein IE53DRAFT_364636 [Violaceomyces palustris]|uniref:Uncharacterized protein n=1 Tax=Violaceomyces palustris TaxID=1673888 RepID=A0ACD0NNX4_9BASI|nr:hypothetical protein IE53DRAFT_364636 [Violaceomyces palustris]
MYPLFAILSTSSSQPSLTTPPNPHLKSCCRRPPYPSSSIRSSILHPWSAGVATTEPYQEIGKKAIGETRRMRTLEKTLIEVVTAIALGASYESLSDRDLISESLRRRVKLLGLAPTPSAVMERNQDDPADSRQDAQRLLDPFGEEGHFLELVIDDEGGVGDGVDGLWDHLDLLVTDFGYGSQVDDVAERGLKRKSTLFRKVWKALNRVRRSLDEVSGAGEVDWRGLVGNGNGSRCSYEEEGRFRVLISLGGGQTPSWEGRKVEEKEEEEDVILVMVQEDDSIEGLVEHMQVHGQGSDWMERLEGKFVYDNLLPLSNLPGKSFVTPQEAVESYWKRSGRKRGRGGLDHRQIDGSSAGERGEGAEVRVNEYISNADDFWQGFSDEEDDEAGGAASKGDDRKVREGREEDKEEAERKREEEYWNSYGSEEAMGGSGENDARHASVREEDGEREDERRAQGRDWIVGEGSEEEREREAMVRRMMEREFEEDGNLFLGEGGQYHEADVAVKGSVKDPLYPGSLITNQDDSERGEEKEEADSGPIPCGKIGTHREEIVKQRDSALRSLIQGAWSLYRSQPTTGDDVDIPSEAEQDEMKKVEFLKIVQQVLET